MGRNRDPKRDEAFAIFRKNNGNCKLIDIANELEVSEGTVRGWKSKDDWEAKIYGTLQKNKERSNIQKSDRKLAKAVEEIEGLTEKEKAFCLHFIKTCNATAAVVRAGYETSQPAVIGFQLKQKPHIQAEIKRLREIRNLDLMATPDDVVELHMRIAKADMTDFASWGRATVPVMGPFGPLQVKDPDSKKKVPLMKEINEMRFVDSSLLDGQIVSEVKVGKDGASIKLVDRQKSLDFLERYFELNPMDRHKKAYDNARLAIKEKKAANQFPPDDDTITGVVALPDVLSAEGEQDE